MLLATGLVSPSANQAQKAPTSTMQSDDFPGPEDPNSAFDKIIRHELPAPRVYEDADVLVFLPNRPFVIGHAVVIRKLLTRAV